MRTLIGQTVVMRADRDGVHIDRTGSHQWTEWQAVERVDESPTSIVIVRTGLGAGAIPKRAFANPDDADAFAAYVRAHTGEHPASERGERIGHSTDRGAPRVP